MQIYKKIHADIFDLIYFNFFGSVQNQRNYEESQYLD